MKILSIHGKFQSPVDYRKYKNNAIDMFTRSISVYTDLIYTNGRFTAIGPNMVSLLLDNSDTIHKKYITITEVDDNTKEEVVIEYNHSGEE